MWLAPEQFFGFLTAAVLITASPGPDNLMVLGVGIARGRGPGVAFGLGCGFGCLSHTVLATLGVSALIAASPLAFTLLKMGGGVYLVWLGVQALRSRGGVAMASAQGVGEARAKLAMRDPADPANAKEIAQGMVEMFKAFQSDMPSASESTSQGDE